MFLKRLDIQGFKTFSTRTVFDFVPGISAVVGPNGAGKSNIADAIRWALGEQIPAPYAAAMVKTSSLPVVAGVLLSVWPR